MSCGILRWLVAIPVTLQHTYVEIFISNHIELISDNNADILCIPASECVS